VDRLEFPGTDPALRDALEAELASAGPAPLFARLAERDPAAAAAIEPANGRRIVRALEVIELTGQPFTAVLPSYDDSGDALQLGLDCAPELLDAAVDQRVERMFASGLVDEVEQLVSVGLREGRTASRALGYQQVLAHLDGRLSLDEAAAETARATRRFVRRQRSWFRRDPRITWLSGTAEDLGVAVALIMEAGQR
jgi:tRNA dimethylallyltransferase